MNMSHTLKLVLIIEVVLLLCNAVILSRDYQDTWILEGLELPFTLLLVTYLAYFSVEKHISWLLVFVVIIRFTMLAVPSLKYPWFQGIAIDQHRHYRLTQDIYDQGYIRSGDLYSGTPLMHLSFAIYSLTTGVEVLESFQFFPILPWLIFPIFTYLLMKKIAPHNLSAQKYALLIASIPVKQSMSLVVIGTLFGPLLVFLLLYQIAKSFQVLDRRTELLLVIFSLALAMTHSFSSITFSLSLVIIYVLWQIVKKMRSKKVIPHFIPLVLNDSILTITGIGLTWFTFISTARDASFRGIYSFIGEALGLVENPLVSEFIAPRFFEIGVLNGLKVLLLFHGADFFLILFSVIGIVIMYKLRMHKSVLMFLSLYLISLLLFEAFGYATSFGWNLQDRTIRLLLVITPIFMGIFFYYIREKTGSKLVPIALISLFLVVSTIQFYDYQPLMPAASSLPNKNLPNDEPLTYINSVNTVYQRDMLLFAEEHFVPGTRIATDQTTAMQLLGVTSYTFSRSFVYYYPLDPDDDPVPYDVFLIHLPGKGGVFGDQAEIVTKDLILSSIYNSDILYTNGESYILNTP